jgi:hypothetical protein
MVKSAGRRVWEVYDERTPDGVKRRVNRVVKITAKATKRLRDKKQIAAQGKVLKRAVAKRLKI